MAPYFDHEKLTVYQRALDFVSYSEVLIGELPKKGNVVDHLTRASDSIVFNIAEGNGRFPNKERQQFFGIARSSALECAGCLDVLVARRLLSPERVLDGKRTIRDIVSMLSGLIRRESEAREDSTEYKTEESYE